MRKTLFTAAITAGSAALLLLSGCTAGGADDDPTKASSDAELGPLSQILSKLSGGEQDEETSNAQAAAMEDAIAACMQDEGFEYIPQDTSGRMVVRSDDDLPAWDSLEYAEQYGYGATTWKDMPGSTPDQEYTDPNADAIAAMSESEQAAFYEALYGKQSQETEPTGVETADPSGDGSSDGEVQEYDWTTAGCQGKAQHDTYEAQQVWDDPEFKDLFDEINKLYTAAQDNPVVVAAREKWVECMADAGYDFAAPQDAQQSIYDKVNEIPYDEESGEQDAAALAELKDDEIATAVADRTCNNSVGLDKAQTKGTRDVEQEFVDSHKDELDALVARAAQAKG